MYGIMSVLISMSVYLGRSFARTNQELQDQLVHINQLSARTIEQERHAKEQEIEQKLLEADLAHKAEQLEEAKKLEKALSDLEKAHMELKDAQAQLIQSEKMAAFGQLGAGSKSSYREALRLVREFGGEE